jgi:hypothetical protein
VNSDDNDFSSHPQDAADQFARDLFEWIKERDFKVSDWIVAITSIVLTVAAICAGFVYSGQLSTMQATLSELQKQTADTHTAASAAEKSADLTREEAESTQAAKFGLNCTLAKYQGQPDLLNCSVVNNGEHSGNILTGDVSVSVLEKYPSSTVIKAYPLLELTERGHIEKGGGTVVTVALDGVKPDDLDCEKRIVKIVVTFTYDNGFAHTIPETICDEMLSVRSDGTSGLPEPISCNAVPMVEEANKFFASQKQKQH